MYDYFSTKLQQIKKNYYSKKNKNKNIEKDVKDLINELLDFNIEICNLLVKVQKETNIKTFKDLSLFIFKYCLSPFVKDNKNIFQKNIINKKINSLLKKFYNYFLLFAFYIDNISQHHFIKSDEKLEDYLKGFKALKKSLR